MFYSIKTFPSQIENGFKALSIFDYFKAKQLFYKEFRKKSACAAYGLAHIYYKNNNPFYNLDSAAKYAQLSYNFFKIKPIQQYYTGFKIDSASILNICDSIAYKIFKQTKLNPSQIDKFLNQNYLANILLLRQAIYSRDEIEYQKIISLNKSDSTQLFIVTHPQSKFLADALSLKDRQLFEEQTISKTDSAFISFINKHHNNIMLNSAFEALYSSYQKKSDINGLKHFVANFTNAPQINEAWKLLFSLTVKSFSNSELEKFLQEYPSFPFKNSILKELELNKLHLFPYQKEDFFGFIDSASKIIIPLVYDAITEFSEGLAVVNKNDSVFYINKENQNAFNQFFTDAYPFTNGIAATKKNNKWNFINRQGQSMGLIYDEINELSNNAYVIKLNGRYGAINHFAQTIIEPRFDKMGDFKNEFAYYIENGKYGFVSKIGYIHRAEFEWISDFNENNIAVVKQNNFYGLINSQGQKILDCYYDLILKATNNVFILVKNNLYGFYNGNGCFLSAISYEYMKEKPTDFYTNGYILKLIKKNEQALADFNGKTTLEFGSYEEVNFALNGLIKVKRKNKYGFIDKKLNIIIPFKYEQAQDFNDSLTVVKLKGKNILINTSGKEIFSTEENIEKISQHFYLLDGEEKAILNNKGEKVFTNIFSLQKANYKLLIITLNNGEIRLIKD